MMSSIFAARSRQREQERSRLQGQIEVLELAEQFPFLAAIESTALAVEAQDAEEFDKHCADALGLFEEVAA